MTRISTPKHVREPTQETEGEESLETHHRGRPTQEHEADYAVALVGLRAQEAASFTFKEAGQEREVETMPVFV